MDTVELDADDVHSDGGNLAGGKISQQGPFEIFGDSDECDSNYYLNGEQEQQQASGVCDGPSDAFGHLA